MRPDVREWFQRRTTVAADWPLAAVLAAKGATTVSVVLPALDEARTVGTIVAALRRDLVERVPLVDEIVVMDSGSVDATVEVAAAAGATVHRGREVLARLGDRPGKGEVLWKSLHVTQGDVVVFVDADLQDFDPGFVVGLVGPLLADDGVDFVKATYDRPLATDAGVLPAGGGRVTELVARPLLNLHWPALSGFVQPLSGEYAGRRSVLERVPFCSGYGVELGMLVDLLDLVGLDRLAQVDLGRRVHRHQADAGLGRMAGQILHAAFTRLERQGRLWAVEPPSPRLVQFRRDGERYDVSVADVGVTDRPPMAEVWEYRADRGRTGEQVG